jgi:hypothetical protein
VRYGGIRIGNHATNLRGKPGSANYSVGPLLLIQRPNHGANPLWGCSDNWQKIGNAAQLCSEGLENALNLMVEVAIEQKISSRLASDIT